MVGEACHRPYGPNGAMFIARSLGAVSTARRPPGRDVKDMAPQTPVRKAPKPKQNSPLFVANPQQAAAIAHTDGPAAFIAAAGTGKTAILVQRLVRLIA